MDLDTDASQFANFNDPASWYNVAGAVFCVLCAALAAGLTVGLMSLDPLELEVKRRVGTPDERRHAEKICPLIASHHRLLVTLLLFNSIANEALPIFLAGLVPGYIAVLISVTAILIFGEIIPSAIFTGPKQIVMASKLSNFVYTLMAFFYPIAYPIGLILDKWLGHNSFKRYTREELSTLVDLQREVGMAKVRRAAAAAGSSPNSSHHSHGGHGGGGHGGGGVNYPHAKEKELGETSRPISVDEATIVAGVLKCHAKKICDAMKPMDEVYTLCEDDKLDENKMCEIMACGFSRIPVHSSRGRQDIRGFLLVKRLIVLDPEDARPVRTLPLRQPIVVSPTGSLLELINVFQEGRSHMAIVSPSPDLTRQALRVGTPLEGRFAPIGIITLEDLFEEILQEEIGDETDNRERQAIESLRRVRRKLRRQRQEQALLLQQDATGQGGRLISPRNRAGAGAGTGAGAGAGGHQPRIQLLHERGVNGGPISVLRVPPSDGSDGSGSQFSSSPASLSSSPFLPASPLMSLLGLGGRKKSSSSSSRTAGTGTAAVNADDPATQSLLGGNERIPPDNGGKAAAMVPLTRKNGTGGGNGGKNGGKNGKNGGKNGGNGNGNGNGYYGSTDPANLPV